MARAKRDRPPYKLDPLWRPYIEYLEGKVGRLEAERDQLQSKLQQGTLDTSGSSLFETPQTVESEEPTPVGRNALFDSDPDANTLGGFTAESETSRKAALANYPKSGNQRHQILLLALKAGPHGITFQDARNSLGIYGADRRISDLCEGGWLERTERTRETDQGEQASVVICTSKAVEWIKVRDPQIFAEATRR